MELITILNRCHRFRGFVYQHAYFSADKKSIEVAGRPRKGSAAVCSRCHLPAPGYDQLAERRFEFIPLCGFLVFLLYTMRSRRLPPLRRCGCRFAARKRANVAAQCSGASGSFAPRFRHGTRRDDRNAPGNPCKDDPRRLPRRACISHVSTPARAIPMTMWRTRLG